jgi:excisionase family DNA binding protein
VDGNPELDGWLTIAEAAQRYGVKRDRLQRAAMQGRLRARKVGSGLRMPWLVRSDDVQRFLRESRRGRPPASGARTLGRHP